MNTKQHVDKTLVIEKIVLAPEISSFSRDEKVQNLPASRSSSEVSAHQVARSASSSSVTVLPSIADSLVL